MTKFEFEFEQHLNFEHIQQISVSWNVINASVKILVVLLITYV